MYSLIFGKTFFSSIKKLDKGLKIKTDKQLKLLQQDPFHPKLHSKYLHGKLDNSYSFRVGKDYRVVFRFMQNRIIQLLTIKHRKEVYK